MAIKPIWPNRTAARLPTPWLAPRAPLEERRERQRGDRIDQRRPRAEQADQQVRAIQVNQIHSVERDAAAKDPGPEDLDDQVALIALNGLALGHVENLSYGTFFVRRTKNVPYEEEKSVICK